MKFVTINRFITKKAGLFFGLVLAGFLALAPAMGAQAAPQDAPGVGPGVVARIKLKGAEPETETEAEEAAEEEEEEDYSRIGIANADSFVYVRTEPSADADYVAKMYAGQACCVLDQTGEWYYVCSGETFGFVYGEYLTIGDPFVCELAKHDVAVIENETPLCGGTSADAASDIMLAPGTEWTVIDSSMWLEGYIYIEGPFCEGFVSLADISGARRYATALTREQEEAERAARIAAAAEDGQTVVDYAMQFLGNPYVYGGTSLTNGCDCSGFVMSVYSYFGVGMAHSSAAQRSVGYAVSASEIAPGDIVCYYGHVGIYIGNGQIIHAATPADGIMISSMYIMSPVAIRRVF